MCIRDSINRCLSLLTSGRRLTTPQAGVGDFADEARRTVRAADQSVPQLVVAVHHAKAMHEAEAFRGIRLQAGDAYIQRQERKRCRKCSADGCYFSGSQLSKRAQEGGTSRELSEV